MKKEFIKINNETIEINIGADTIVSVDQLIDGLSSQPSLLAYYGEQRAIAIFYRNEASNFLDLMLSACRQEIRQDKQKKLTKEEVNDLAELKDDIIDARRKLNELEFAVDKLTAAYYAIRERGTSLVTMGHVYRAELNINDKLLEEKVKNMRNNNEE